jgi:hypothetical protein
MAPPINLDLVEHGMSQPPSDEPIIGHGQPPEENETNELENRIVTIEGLDDSSLGSFTSLDWVIVVVGAVLIPGVILWWAA